MDNIIAQYGTHFVYRPTIGEMAGVEDGNNGIYIVGQDNAITNSEIAYSAGSAVVMVGYRNNERNCLVNEFGYMGTISSGVLFSGQDSS